MQEISHRILDEVKKTVIGKDAVVRKVYMAILAGGHILLEDIPGVGKTTLALAFAGAMDLRFRRFSSPRMLRLQISPVILCRMRRRESCCTARARRSATFSRREINRASPKTQSALLEVMEEGQITVDGVTRRIPLRLL